MAEPKKKVTRKPKTTEEKILKELKSVNNNLRVIWVMLDNIWRERAPQ